MMGRSAPTPLLLLAFLLWRCFAAAKAGCEKGTYRDAQRQTCSPCTPCQDKYQYERRCSEDSDAVCKCAPEYECGDLECGSCVCGIGEEWNGAGCQECPEGKFKAWISGKCQNWTQCPANQISIPGTVKTDVVCNTTTEGPTKPQTWPVLTKETEQDSHLVPISIALAVALLLCVLFLVLFCIFFRSWAREKFPAVILKVPLGQLAQEVDDCSYRYPEEEEGGSNETAGLTGQLMEKIP
ncbi:tumor necrosis factor receptor superfamily member 9 [Podarcis raffonei]|uniref:tumor necrosis factor receptor superfamily member 9 n=1 Tax=Podarcis raffonei TaxID=65483 RepID=UPI0023295784|nr:tumor necrosis factor receptor superfamily member 9 [Podarcis raffonei]